MPYLSGKRRTEDEEIQCDLLACLIQVLDPHHFGSQHRQHLLWRLVEEQALMEHPSGIDDPIQVP